VFFQLRGRGIEAFLPMVMRWTRWKDRKKQVAHALFPGYCFARIDPRHWRPVLTCPGVVMVVSFGGVPARIPDVEIENIRTLVMSQLRYDPCPLIPEGALVEVVSGPLQGVVGRLVRKNARARVVLSVDVIAQGVSVEVDAADVRLC
jgi:transcription antitermination factor NusG